MLSSQASQGPNGDLALNSWLHGHRPGPASYPDTPAGPGPQSDPGYPWLPPLYFWFTPFGPAHLVHLSPALPHLPAANKRWPTISSEPFPSGSPQAPPLSGYCAAHRPLSPQVPFPIFQPGPLRLLQALPPLPIDLDSSEASSK